MKNVQGAEAFKESIGRAPEKFQPGLRQLYDSAISFEQEKIVELSTYISRKGDYYRIYLMVPGTGQYFVSFNNLLWNGKERGGEISFWPMENDLAPNSLRKFDKLIGEVKSKSGVRHRRLSKMNESDLPAVLTTIHGAYRETRGSTTE